MVAIEGGGNRNWDWSGNKTSVYIILYSFYFEPGKHIYSVEERMISYVA